MFCYIKGSREPGYGVGVRLVIPLASLFSIYCLSALYCNILAWCSWAAVGV